MHIEVLGQIDDHLVVGRDEATIEFEAKLVLRIEREVLRAPLGLGDLPLMLARANFEVEELYVRETYGLYGMN